MMPRASIASRSGTLLSSLGLAVALALGGCASSGAPSPKIAADMPTAWAEATPSPSAAVVAPDWWGAFNSPELSAVIAGALAANPDLASATEHVVQAEAQVRIAGATLFPQLSVGADTARSASRAHGGAWQTSDGSSAGFSASYEVDLWGRNAAGVRSAESLLRASRFDLESLRLTLVSGVAGAYFQVLSLRARLLIARENLVIANRVLAVVDARVRFGAASQLDLARQQTAVLAQRALIPPLELQERQTLFALALLLGRAPEGFEIGSTGSFKADAGNAPDFADLAVPAIAPGLPTDLLLRRPDLASAEAQLAAANANVAAARAALLPGIQLTGSAGLASTVLLNFLHAPTAAWSLGASLLQPIFDGGRLRAQVQVASSVERELVEVYRKAILAALADVESTLAASSRSADQAVLQEQILEQARRALRLAEIRYREGADDLLIVLDAQRTLFQAEDQRAQIRLSRLLASLGLFKALGGGWQLSEAPRGRAR
jgi:NodT family efflux transporter outer membrane factor (OMF) lipoprotein